MTDCDRRREGRHALLRDSRWMPPSPHRDAILDELRRGRAHIEERGHDRSPLFVYEDGGVMELALMRLVDGRLVAVSGAGLPETGTKHVDVCGTIDELEALWAERPELADTDPEQLFALVEHALAMLRRMEQRLSVYSEFAESVRAAVSEMTMLRPPDHALAPALRQRLRDAIGAGGAAVAADFEALVATAEELRDIASASEEVLYRYRDLAIAIGNLYEGVRGARDWSQPGQTPAPPPAPGYG
ncbi:MAG: hypothetical protein HYU66_27165 [Armatimonadetes bacterium]|nr:hypothetical protein [Armatimonadota bacterium]